MDSSFFDLAKAGLQFVILPIAGVAAHFYKKTHKRIEDLESISKHQEIRTAVMESQINDMRDDLKEIKRGVEKLVDRK